MKTVTIDKGTSALDYLRQAGYKPVSELNYCTENGVEYYIGEKGREAAVIALIHDENLYTITKPELKEMSWTADAKGIDKIILFTNYGIELHSRLEKPKDVGFDSIVKVLSSDTEHIKEEVAAAYDKNGQSSAFEVANKYNVPYEYCKPCETDSPSIDHECLICGSGTTPAPATTNTEEKEDTDTPPFTNGEWKVTGTSRSLQKLHIAANGENIAAIFTSIPQANANARIIEAAPKMYRLLKSVSQMLVHFEGDAKGNKVKTDILKHCPNVRDVMNNINQLLWKL